jgi:hypothetical protein
MADRQTGKQLGSYNKGSFYTTVEEGYNSEAPTQHVHDVKLTLGRSTARTYVTKNGK